MESDGCAAGAVGLGAELLCLLFRRMAGRKVEHVTEESFEEEILTIVSEGEREGLLEEDAREMIEGVIELGDVTVARIMTPRTDMVSIHIDHAVGRSDSTGHHRRATRAFRPTIAAPTTSSAFCTRKICSPSWPSRIAGPAAVAGNAPQAVFRARNQAGR